MQQNEVICFLLALYEKAALSQTSSERLQGNVSTQYIILLTVRIMIQFCEGNRKGRQFY